MNVVIDSGHSSPLGLSFKGKRANFAIFSDSASSLILGLKSQGELQEIPLCRTGDVWHAAIEGWIDGMEYAFRNGAGTWLADPYSRTPATSLEWGRGVDTVWSYMKTVKQFDWQQVLKPAIPLSDLVIYEMHVRSFTFHPSSGASHPGTYLGIIEKIPYLCKLGINAIELMPVFEFDETQTNPTAQGLFNVWGYDPLCFFSPMRRYTSKEDANEEFKTLVRELHKNGIEVILDVVYNHTGEIGDRRYHFRGLSDETYYMIDSQGRYLDYTGCKNTLNVNHPVVAELILSSLRFWAEEMQVDGFRFDLASILTRGQNGEVLERPPIVNAISNDPILKTVKLIAESWDASGLYQLGKYPDFGPWSEWNGQYRDRIRNFMKGDLAAGQFADVLSGSEFLYRSHNPCCSINFVTAHDGFCLNDLVSYTHKQNEANGQMNCDGTDQNFSWNCGIEGPTQDPTILALRERQMRNFFLALFCSQGIPMFFMGDEYGHTRNGNNNPYVQDNAINWFLWDETIKREDRIEFVSSLIAFRERHPELRRNRFLTSDDINWHGRAPFHADWSQESRLVACTLKGTFPVYLAFNSYSESKTIELPPGPWHQIVRTDLPWNHHSLRCPKEGPILSTSCELVPHSALLAVNLSLHLKASIPKKTMS